MKNLRTMTALLAAALTALLPAFFTVITAAYDSGFTHFTTTNNPDCFSDITIEGNHFTVNGRSVSDPVTKVRFSTNSVNITNYEFTAGSDSTFHAEFDARYSDSQCELWIVQSSGLVMNYRIYHNESGWYFPDNGLAELNAEKLENILTAAPEASAYYISVTADPEEIEETLGSLERTVQEVCGNEQDDYRKALLIYRWISDNFYYDNDAAASGVTLDTVAIHNVLERRRTTCAGFANTYCAMLEIAGIRSLNLKGSAVAADVTYEELLTAGENHEFTAFWYGAENRWVYADPTWGRKGIYEKGKYIPGNYPSTEKYFDETGEAFALKHRIDKAEERNYSAALSTEEETAGTSEPSETSETSETSQTTSTEKTSPPSATTPTSSAQNGTNVQSGNLVIYIVIGASGVIIVAIGITLAVRKSRKDEEK